MKIVKILGGLGNQMFQYALGISLAKSFPQESIKLDTHCFNGYSKHNGLELSRLFEMRFPEATFIDIMKIAYPYPHYQIWRFARHILPNRKKMCVESVDMAFNETVLQQKGNQYFDGYWQNELYFKDVRAEILQTFKFPILDIKNEKLSQQLTNSNSISIHIRRGDYIKDPLFKGTCPISYYKQAISTMCTLTKPDLFCIFSDDMDWCKKHFSVCLKNTNTIFVDWNQQDDNYKDMQLMSLCKHHIIANSSFSWWGAWLNSYSKKIVIGPKTWANRKEFHSPMCGDWLQL